MKQGLVSMCRNLECYGVFGETQIVSLCRNLVCYGVFGETNCVSLFRFL